jgi:hypothetical protein
MAQIAAALLVALLAGCAAPGHGIRAMSDRWCAEHGNPSPQCVQVAQ